MNENLGYVFKLVEGLKYFLDLFEFFFPAF